DHLRYQKDSGNRNRTKRKYMKQLWISGSYESMYIKFHVRKLIIGCSFLDQQEYINKSFNLKP
ncbi:hypothetical protein ACNF42_08285, partial [Cuniculiplasma sp. SKW3]|uniref:hypothetical protein n=1 Tax=Cuniculiplasma sp. SKW3 TaxID=3400170 RepID=UPI003FD359E1